MSKKQKVANNVVSFGAADAVEPLEGWEVKSRYGFMRCGADPGDRLVSVYDVIDWLMKTRELPLGVAVDGVCCALEKNGDSGVYFLSNEDYATAVGLGSGFAKFRSKEDTTASRLKAALLMKAHDLRRLVNAPGEDVEFNASEQTPYEFVKQTQGGGLALAVSIQKAFELWGWGRKASACDEAMQVVTQSGWSEIVAIKRANKNAPLSVEQKQVLAKEFEGRSGQGVAKSMANELGISVTAFNELKKCKSGKRMKNKQRNGIDTVLLARKTS